MQKITEMVCNLRHVVAAVLGRPDPAHLAHCGPEHRVAWDEIAGSAEVM